MSPSLVTVSYLAAAALFILALGGLKTNDTARRGNLFGIIGMIIAILITVAAFVTQHYTTLVVIMVVVVVCMEKMRVVFKNSVEVERSAIQNLVKRNI